MSRTTRDESSRFRFPLGDPDSIVDRRRFLVDRARDLRVVHLGCADERLTRRRAGTGDLLHEELTTVAGTLLGIDLSEEALATMSELVPGNYARGDVEQLDAVDLPEECDLVIAAELIEHLRNPGNFLDGLGTYLRRTGATAIITTPNAYSWKQFATFAVRGAESTHPDHVLVYSPVTLRHTIERAGLEIRRYRVHAWPASAGVKQRVIGLVDRAVLRWNPWLGIGLVVEIGPAD